MSDLCLNIFDLEIDAFRCALHEPVLIEADERKGDAFITNGPLDKVTLPFNLQSLYDLDFDTLTFSCEIDLCTLDQYCRQVSIL